MGRPGQPTMTVEGGLGYFLWFRSQSITALGSGSLTPWVGGVTSRGAGGSGKFAGTRGSVTDALRAGAAGVAGGGTRPSRRRSEPVDTRDPSGNAGRAALVNRPAQPLQTTRATTASPTTMGESR